ncbi:thioredoxin-dependent thiol peroxidase [Aestuariibius sp. HNIBRBA575]|uniref:thioredoxin-dependent thiol peroxidase n=1 Tax=Aestuariibius sp. HNIBRBA575 TaxID=3233343 RepID=UPI0034A5ABC0
MAQSPALVIGANAPEFTLPRDGAGDISLSDLRGQAVVLYFYPKDDTSGCTKQAIAFSERLAEFDALGAVILGVSKDSVTKHNKFRDKHSLKVALLSDEDSTTCEDYGVWVEKKMYGKTFMGIERATFLIAPDGKIAHIWRKVKVAGHEDAVLDQLKAL